MEKNLIVMLEARDFKSREVHLMEVLLQMNLDKLNNIIKKKSNGNNNLAHHFHQMFFLTRINEVRKKQIQR